MTSQSLSHLGEQAAPVPQRKRPLTRPAQYPPSAPQPVPPSFPSEGTTLSPSSVQVCRRPGPMRTLRFPGHCDWLSGGLAVSGQPIINNEHRPLTFAGMMGKELPSLSVAKWTGWEPAALGPSLLLQETARKQRQPKSSEADRLNPRPASNHASTPGTNIGTCQQPPLLRDLGRLDSEK